jgi:hypothetical protein
VIYSFISFFWTFSSFGSLCVRLLVLEAPKTLIF